MKITKDSYFLFSGGEVHSKLSPEIADTGVESVEIICKDYSMNGFMALCKFCSKNNKHRPQNQKGYIQSLKAKENHKEAMKKIIWTEQRRAEMGKRTAERNSKNSLKNNPEYWTPDRRAKMIRKKKIWK